MPITKLAAMGDVLQMASVRANIRRATAYIIALKYGSGGLKKEFVLLGDGLKRHGINVRYLLAKPYSAIEGNRDEMHYLTFSKDLKTTIVDLLKAPFYKKKLIAKIFKENPPSFVCFYNTHPLNPFIANFAKNRFREVITACYLHDPYKPNKTSYGKAKQLILSL